MKTRLSEFYDFGHQTTVSFQQSIMPTPFPARRLFPPFVEQFSVVRGGSLIEEKT